MQYPNLYKHILKSLVFKGKSFVKPTSKKSILFTCWHTIARTPAMACPMAAVQGV
jgi:hypothetical protein